MRLAIKSLATDLGAGVHVLEDGQLLVRIHLDKVLSKINDDFLKLVFQLLCALVSGKIKSVRHSGNLETKY